MYMYWNILFSMFGLHIEMEGFGAVNILLEHPNMHPNAQQLAGKLWQYKKPLCHNGSYSIEETIQEIDEQRNSMSSFPEIFTYLI